MVIGSLLLVLTVALRRLALLGAARSSRPKSRARSKRRRAKNSASRKSSSRCRTSRTAARCSSQRVALIDELRKGQTAPVHMIDQVSKALPEMTWLTSMQQNGYTLTIQGRCLTLTSLSDFVGNLEASHYFMRPVEIIESTVVAGEAGKGPELIQFTIRGTFQMAGCRFGAAAGAGLKPAKGGRRG